MKPRGDHPPGGRDIHNRLKANTVSTAGGKTPPVPSPLEGATYKDTKQSFVEVWSMERGYCAYYLPP